MLIGLVGHIGAGKTQVAKIFAKHGAFVISADQIGKNVVEQNNIVLKKLVKAFGSQILTSKGKLKRKFLGRLAFKNEKSKKKLNSIVHPYLLKELDRLARQAQKKYEIVVIDAALLIDWGWDKKVNLTILVNAGLETKIERLVKTGYTAQEARMRLKSQKSYTALRKRADIVILNINSLKNLEIKVLRIIKRLT